MKPRLLSRLFWWALGSLLPLINDPALAQLSAPPKREFRGVWVATVSNIDWPSRNTLAAEQQRAEFVALLDQHQRSGLNAVVVQVRAACDALYPSQLEPWSSVLTGQQGQAPGYDPLAFMIAEARRRGLEFHAWFNPYRAVSDARNARLAPNHLANTQPSWLRPYGNARYLDPGLPEVRAHVVRVIMDVARRYDVDAIHFDDYFYPYPETGQVFNDDSTFRVHARGFTNRADWRRDNVDLLVRAVADSLRAAKPWVKFGISPFGIWQNRGTATPLGSDTRGLQSFSEIFADSRKWAQQGWVDYLAPQLYWSIGFTAARYEVLVPWWAQNSFGRHLYIGQGAYRINTTSDPNWLNPSQMPNQLRLNRTTAEVNGSIFFSSRSVTGNLLAIQDSLRQDFYRHPALLPLVPWRDATPPPAPTGLVASLTRQGVQLRWDRPTAPAGPLDRVRQFVIYRFENNQAPDLAQARFIRAVTPTDTTAFLDLTTNLADVRYTYVITALDRLHNESPASNPASLLVTASPQASPLASLRPAYPNPAQTTARLPFNLASPGPVQLALHDLTGRPLAPLVEATLPAGPHEYELNVTSLPPGTYLWSLATPHFRGQGRLVVVR